MEAWKKDRIAEITRLEQAGKMTAEQKKERDDLRYEHIELWSEKSKNPPLEEFKKKGRHKN
jgi:uncharacterized protein YnzC (UPF0291/DUF896 family)